MTPTLPALPFAVFDELGIPCDDRMQDYATAAVLADRAAPGEWQPIETAPKDGTEFLAWFQKHRLDEDDESTDEVIGGAQAIVSCSGGQWDEPQWLEAHGAYFMEDWCFAEEPILWHALPAAPKHLSEGAG